MKLFYSFFLPSSSSVFAVDKHTTSFSIDSKQKKCLLNLNGKGHVMGYMKLIVLFLLCGRKRLKRKQKKLRNGKITELHHT